VRSPRGSYRGIPLPPVIRPASQASSGRNRFCLVGKGRVKLGCVRCLPSGSVALLRVFLASNMSAAELRAQLRCCTVSAKNIGMG